jgi:hypothetical protein
LSRETRIMPRRQSWPLLLSAISVVVSVLLALGCTGEIGGANGGHKEGDPLTGPCVPKSCTQLGYECGTAPDGCGGVVICGTCKGGLHCGGGGQNRCGTDPCTPKTCAQVSASCGYASDTCATALDCGGCPAPLTCGGGGWPNVCGCVPKSCIQLDAECGTAPDGCGGIVSCGECPGGQTCGGAGPNRCGSGSCAPKTCAQQGASCGVVSDDCASAIDCGRCAAPSVCGGGGLANQCGCTPKSCVSLSLSCGTAENGCGGTLQCGSCSLPNATAACVSGSCKLSGCDAGFDDCDGNPQNGCETNLLANPTHCGACGNVCAAPEGTPTCNAGVCSISTCNSGRGDCDGDPANGCETDLGSSSDHCGFCGNGCAYANASGRCASGSCQLESCSPGFGNCDGSEASGCETDLGASLEHCGGCGRSCSPPANATAACSGGSCDFACIAPFEDCDGNAGTGCETNLSNSTNACGSCSRDCASPRPANTSGVGCQSGNCVISGCSGGYYDINGQYDDGCECGSDSVADACGSAQQVNPNPIGLGGSGSSGTNTIAPEGDQDFFQINFAGNTSCGYRPRVELSDATGMLRFDVTAGCGAGATCNGVRVWEFNYSGVCGFRLPNDPGKTPSQFTSVQVRVYAAGSLSQCASYTLSVSN